MEANLFKKYADIKKEVGEISFIEELIKKYKRSTGHEKNMALGEIQKAIEDHSQKYEEIYLINRKITIPQDKVEIATVRRGGEPPEKDMFYISLFIFVILIFIVFYKKSECPPVSLPVGYDL